MTALPQMDSYWMPFSASKGFSQKPRIIAQAKGMYYYDHEGRKMLDSCAGLWCCNAGHCRTKIVEAIQRQAAVLDFAPTFQYGHPGVYAFTEQLSSYFPDGLNHIFLCNSGSEAGDSALKIALAYQRLRGKGSKQMFVGRERGYHGVGFGGISVGGIVKNRLWFGNQLLRTDHLSHTCLPQNAFSRGEPEEGGEALANELVRIVQLHDASTVAAVIVEPVAGSAGVLPPPKGYLKRLRQICDEHDILLIFDEVITAFGRLGKRTGAEYFGVTPDMITFAKGSTSGTVPLGGVAVRDEIRQLFLEAAGDENAIDLFHGYTYSGHPLAVAAGQGTLALYEEEGLMEGRDDLIAYFEEAVHSLRDHPHVKDIRNIGFMGAVELEPIAGKPMHRVMEIMQNCFHHKDLVIRVAGEIIALSPPLIMEKAHIDEMVGKIGDAIKETK